MNNLQQINLFTVWFYRLLYYKNKSIIWYPKLMPGKLLIIYIKYFELKKIRQIIIFGLCIGLKKAKNVSYFYLRNVVGGVLVNLKILLHSPLLYKIRTSKLRFVKINKAKFTFLLYLPFLFRINKGIFLEFHKNLKIKKL